MAVPPLAFFRRPVIAALTFQGMSLFVGVASVPLLLFFLSNDDFLAWILISTFGALTIQIEQGIQIVAARRLARLWHSANRVLFLEELELIRGTYRKFALSVFFGLGSAGFLYFWLFAELSPSPIWPYAWVAFILSYGLNYLFGYNTVVLLATENTVHLNLTSTLTRGINFVLTFYLLWQGLSILGLSLSFLASVGLSITLLRRRANEQIEKFSDRPPLHSQRETSVKRSDRAASTVANMAYTLSNFFLYKGAFLVFPLLPGASDISGYGLSLQLVAIVYAVSIIPTQVWLDRLVHAVLQGDVNRVRSNLLISLAFGAVVFTAFFLAIVVLARPALVLIGSDVELPSNALIGLIFLAFGIESIIFMLVNLLLILEETRVLWRYIVGVWIALTVSCATQIVAPAIGITTVFLLVPMLIQAFTTLPVVLWHAMARVKALSGRLDG